MVQKKRVNLTSDPVPELSDDRKGGMAVFWRDIRDFGGAILTSRLAQAIIVAMAVYCFMTCYYRKTDGINSSVRGNSSCKRELELSLKNQEIIAARADSLQQVIYEIDAQCDERVGQLQIELNDQMARTDSIMHLLDVCRGFRAAKVVKKGRVENSSPAPKRVKKQTPVKQSMVSKPEKEQVRVVQKQPQKTTQPKKTVNEDKQQVQYFLWFQNKKSMQY